MCALTAECHKSKPQEDEIEPNVQVDNIDSSVFPEKAISKDGDEKTAQCKTKINVSNSRNGTDGNAAAHLQLFGVISGNERDKAIQLTLTLACSVGNLILVKKLLNMNPNDVKTADTEGNTPLMIASQGGFGRIVQYLLLDHRGRVDIDAVNATGFTALMKAALRGRTSCARMLVVAGADVTKVDWGLGLRAEEWASRCGMKDTAVAIKNVASCTLTRNQTKDFKWSKSQMNRAANMCHGVHKQFKSAFKVEKDRWLAEAGALYHLTWRITALNNAILSDSSDEGVSTSPIAIGYDDVIIDCVPTNDDVTRNDAAPVETTNNLNTNEQNMAPEKTSESLSITEKKKSKSRKKDVLIPEIRIIKSSPIRNRDTQHLKRGEIFLRVPEKSSKKRQQQVG